MLQSLLILLLSLQNIIFSFVLLLPTSFCQIINDGHNNYQNMPISQIQRNNFNKWQSGRHPSLLNVLNNINQQTLEQLHQRQQNSQQNSLQFPNYQQKQQNYNQQQPYYLNNQKGLIRLPNNNNAESSEKGEAIVTEIKPASLTHISGQHSFLVDSREILIPPPPPPLQPWRRLKKHNTKRGRRK
uniref:Uncharacterized protein n=1 Tax=Meloidogyne enterolobii TaxID=390850 RepID=A0A6V7Y020_MELEN|nr:unnamed protein product [Meloidogyne enterolobii]